jgi:hypothetical protein
MGYDTTFSGSFLFDRPLDDETRDYLVDFNNERHEGREYPGYYCQWTPNEDGTALVWDEGEKFYDYTEWLKYLIEHVFIPRGYVLNGEVSYQGDDNDDRGLIIAENNEVRTTVDKIISRPDALEVVISAASKYLDYLFELRADLEPDEKNIWDDYTEQIEELSDALEELGGEL